MRHEVGLQAIKIGLQPVAPLVGDRLLIARRPTFDFHWGCHPHTPRMYAPVPKPNGVFGHLLSFQNICYELLKCPYSDERMTLKNR